jgi:hypothetical protein
VGELARASPRARDGVLVTREDGCVMPRHPTHGTEASLSCAVLPVPNGAVTRPERE